jgi:hypothetical protein
MVKMQNITLQAIQALSQNEEVDVYGLHIEEFSKFEGDVPVDWNNDGPFQQVPDGIRYTEPSLVYGYKTPNGAFTKFPKPALMWLPALSGPAFEQDLTSPYRVWRVDRDYFAGYTNVANANITGTGIRFENVAVSDGWITGVAVVVLELFGRTLINSKIPFKTKSELVLVDRKIFVFSVRLILRARSINPVRVCIEVNASGPFGLRYNNEFCNA